MLLAELHEAKIAKISSNGDVHLAGVPAAIARGVGSLVRTAAIGATAMTALGIGGAVYQTVSDPTGENYEQTRALQNGEIRLDGKVFQDYSDWHTIRSSWKLPKPKNAVAQNHPTKGKIYTWTKTWQTTKPGSPEKITKHTNYWIRASDVADEPTKKVKK